MEKPIVFLSHSSHDKAPLLALKKLLDERAAGSLEFFLSSDGESIRFGRNWVVRVSDALSRAQLMFIFLSPKSANSKWIHFEAGCAYSKDVQVVPVCLSGIELDRITPPLSLLQGFNLHSHEALGNIARTCNEQFKMKMNEVFSREDFDSINKEISDSAGSFFGEQTELISEIGVSVSKGKNSPDSKTIASLKEICIESGEHPLVNTLEQRQQYFGGAMTQITKLELPGCIVQFEGANLSIRLSPDRFHINAHLIDKWFEKENFQCGFVCRVNFSKQVTGEQSRLRITSRLHRYGINAIDASHDTFAYKGYSFHLYASGGRTSFHFDLSGKLADDRFSTVLKNIFEAQVLWINTPDWLEMMQQ